MNKTKTEKDICLDAIDYFFKEGFLEEMKSDQQFYVKALLDRVAESYNIKLEW
jgi:hypothetical protein